MPTEPSGHGEIMSLRDGARRATPSARGDAVRFRVFLDGQPPGAAHGLDVDDHGHGTVLAQRLYQLIRQP